MSSVSIEATIPPFLRRLGTDEWIAPRRSPLQRRLAWEVHDRVEAIADQARRPPALAATTRRATAAGLRALNREFGSEFYSVSPDAERNADAADDAFSSVGPVFDVQTHFLAPHSAAALGRDFLFDMYQSLMPTWWNEMDDLDVWTFAEYLRNVFVDSETAVAVLTSGPGVLPTRNLFNDELDAARRLLDEVGASGRLLNHAVVHADIADEVARMGEWRDEFDPVGWKVYTLPRMTTGGLAPGWMLDDEATGLPFLEQARRTGVTLVCAHKGISRLADNGSPRDIGPAAKVFRDLDFVVYHSGYETPLDTTRAEGPYDGGNPHGVDRLLASLDEAEVGAGSNVYAELGSTWFCLVSRPVEAAHVLGKLIARVGVDNVLWGTDSIWFGSPQPIIDAFRTFQIPDSMCEEFGYQPLSDTIKAKILGENAARVYGIDLDAAARRKAVDDNAWAHELADRYERGLIAAFR
jgi:uncharacterized protein